ncbi:MAG: hypothetical protein EB053_06360, partial [Chlamydiae bacterium]|nr:hypothetical protein [Chlamydiota bacterium]
AIMALNTAHGINDNFFNLLPELDLKEYEPQSRLFERLLIDYIPFIGDLFTDIKIAQLEHYPTQNYFHKKQVEDLSLCWNGYADMLTTLATGPLLSTLNPAVFTAIGVYQIAKSIILIYRICQDHGDSKVLNWSGMKVSSFVLITSVALSVLFTAPWIRDFIQTKSIQSLAFVMGGYSLSLLAGQTLHKIRKSIGLRLLDAEYKEYISKKLDAWMETQPVDAKQDAESLKRDLLDKANGYRFDLSLLSSKITSLPDILHNCRELHISQCHNLRSLAPLPECSKLDLNDCHVLETLPGLSKCIRFVSIDNPMLERVPDLQSCRRFFCQNCPQLRFLPDTIPNCENFWCRDTGVNHLPRLPADCRIEHNIFANYHRYLPNGIVGDLRGMDDVHHGNRDRRTKDALRLLWQTRLNADQINRQFEDFIHYFDGLAHSEKKTKANLALRAPKRVEEVFGPLLDDQQFSIHGFMLEGKELIARLWNFISSLGLNEQPLAKEGILTALSDSFAPGGDRVCNQGKTQRLCISVLQGRLNGVQIDDIEIPNHDLTTHLNFFFANEERRAMEPHQLREQARLYCDQNPLVARGEFLAQVELVIGQRE